MIVLVMLKYVHKIMVILKGKKNIKLWHFFIPVYNEIIFELAKNKHIHIKNR